MPENIILFGSQTITPLVPTVYNLIAVPNATASLNNNYVYINVDCTAAGCNIYLPSASSFGSKSNIVLIINRLDSTLNVCTLYFAASDVLVGSYGAINQAPNLNLVGVAPIGGIAVQLQIIGQNKWLTPYL